MPDQQVDATRPANNSIKRALVLAGAGAAGNAWQLGLIAGLAEAGVDLTEADLIIGTSAGSTVAAQITSGTRPAALYAAILAEVPPSHAGDARSGRGRGPHLSGPAYMDWSAEIIASAQDASDMRRRMGAAALAMDASNGSSGTRWRDIVAARLPSHRWPQQSVLITAVDAHTGEPVVFDRHSGIDLVDAVAARSGRTDTSTAAIDATRTPTWRPDTGGCWCCHHSATGRGRHWNGAWTSQPKSMNCAQAAAGSRPSFRMPARATCSTPMPWIRRRACRPREEVTTKAEPSRSSSPTSGADAGETGRRS
ncbi:patatin-like phospholipase family protein [Agromyces bauzanensis]